LYLIPWVKKLGDASRQKRIDQSQKSNRSIPVVKTTVEALRSVMDNQGCKGFVFI